MKNNKVRKFIWVDQPNYIHPLKKKRQFSLANGRRGSQRYSKRGKESVCHCCFENREDHLARDPSSL